MKKLDDKNVLQAGREIPPPEVFATMSKESLKVLTKQIYTHIASIDQRIDPMEVSLREEGKKLDSLQEKTEILEKYYHEGVPKNPDPLVAKDLNQKGVYNALQDLYDEGKPIEESYLNQKSKINDLKIEVMFLENETEQIQRASLDHDKYNPALTDSEKIEVKASVHNKLNTSLQSTVQESVDKYRQQSESTSRTDPLTGYVEASLQNDAFQFSEKVARELSDYDSNRVNAFLENEGAKTQQAISYLGSFIEQNSGKMTSENHQVLNQELVKLQVKADMINTATVTANQIAKNDNPAEIVRRFDVAKRELEAYLQSEEQKLNKSSDVQGPAPNRPATTLSSSDKTSNLSNQSENKQDTQKAETRVASVKARGRDSGASTPTLPPHKWVRAGSSSAMKSQRAPEAGTSKEAVAPKQEEAVSFKK